MVGGHVALSLALVVHMWFACVEFSTLACVVICMIFAVDVSSVFNIMPRTPPHALPPGVQYIDRRLEMLSTY